MQSLLGLVSQYCLAMRIVLATSLPEHSLRQGTTRQSGCQGLVSAKPHVLQHI